MNDESAIGSPSRQLYFHRNLHGLVVAVAAAVGESDDAVYLQSLKRMNVRMKCVVAAHLKSSKSHWKKSYSEIVVVYVKYWSIGIEIVDDAPKNRTAIVSYSGDECSCHQNLHMTCPLRTFVPLK